MPTIINNLVYKETSIPRRRASRIDIFRPVGPGDHSYLIYLGGTSETGEQVFPRAITIDNLLSAGDCTIKVNGIESIVSSRTRQTYPIPMNLQYFEFSVSEFYDMTATLYILEHHIIIPDKI